MITITIITIFIERPKRFVVFPTKNTAFFFRSFFLLFSPPFFPRDKRKINLFRVSGRRPSQLQSRRYTVYTPILHVAKTFHASFRASIFVKNSFSPWRPLSATRTVPRQKWLVPRCPVAHLRILTRPGHECQKSVRVRSLCFRFLWPLRDTFHCNIIGGMSRGRVSGVQTPSEILANLEKKSNV